MRVRRSSDNDECNIPWCMEPTGRYYSLCLNTLTGFVGANTGYVSVWYNQFCGGADAIQTTTTAQPIIVTSGTVETVGGLPSIKFGSDASTRLLFNAPYAGATDYGTLYSVSSRYNTTYSHFLGATGNVSYKIGSWVRWAAILATNTTYSTLNASQLMTVTQDTPGANSTVVGRLNGTQIASLAGASSSSPSQWIIGSGVSANEHWQGHLSTLLLTKNLRNSVDLLATEKLLAGLYGITLP